MGFLEEGNTGKNFTSGFQKNSGAKILLSLKEFLAQLEIVSVNTSGKLTESLLNLSPRNSQFIPSTNKKFKEWNAKDVVDSVLTYKSALLFSLERFGSAEKSIIASIKTERVRKLYKS
ncbi:hypothetical protein MKW98_021158 [Papaver atlanticum]|uniref:Uncharacterized protein n=1 Tax=Papaver atlanticum TaxID=357466 RepID=A0AAD4XU40_9MAGN|nr:hypothetical protein MKW98_021158 [Papaver atlanticum]